MPPSGIEPATFLLVAQAVLDSRVYEFRLQLLDVACVVRCVGKIMIFFFLVIHVLNDATDGWVCQLIKHT